MNDRGATVRSRLARAASGESFGSSTPRRVIIIFLRCVGYMVPSQGSIRGLGAILETRANVHDLACVSRSATVPRRSVRIVDPVVREVGDKIRDMIRSGNLNPFSAIDIIRAATKIGASRDAVEEIVTEVAKGADGIGGTEDDLIPMATLDILRTLLRSGIVRDLVAWVYDLVSPAAPPDAHQPARDSQVPMSCKFAKAVVRKLLPCVRV